MNKLIIIEKLPQDKTPFFRFLIELADLSLKEAKEVEMYIEENLPCPLVIGISPEKCKIDSEKLLAMSCIIKVEDTSIEHPMLIFPRARYNYKRNFLGTKKI